eukprot:277531-Chlamydomonas_euryale.AAC.2
MGPPLWHRQQQQQLRRWLDGRPPDPTSCTGSEASPAARPHAMDQTMLHAPCSICRCRCRRPGRGPAKAAATAARSQTAASP